MARPMTAVEKTRFKGYLRRALLAANESMVEVIVKEKTVKSYLSAAQRKALAEEREQIPVELRTAYESAFAAWKATWFNGGLAINSNPHTRAVGKEYDALIAMGAVIVPLVVESLAAPENFFVLHLYDAIQANERRLVQYEPDDEQLLAGE